MNTIIVECKEEWIVSFVFAYVVIRGIFNRETGETVIYVHYTIDNNSVKYTLLHRVSVSDKSYRIALSVYCCWFACGDYKYIVS